MDEKSRDNKEPLQVDRIPIAPISEKVSRTSVSLPDELWDDLMDATKVLSDRAKRDGRKPFTRDDVIAHACRWWLEAWREQNAKNKKD